MWTTIDSPVGELRLVALDGALTAVEFLGEMPDGPGEAASVRHHASRGTTPEDGRARGDRVDDDALLVETARQLAAYFAGDLKDFDLPVAPEGTPFQQRVWAALQGIGYGETRTYGEIAGGLGLTGHGARAVGLANGRNPIPIVIPCHRVVGADGSLTGYGGGMHRKQTLLALEQTTLF
jgi:methylated-DNA-[protein]-cysteine S-methyltransferase